MIRGAITSSGGKYRYTLTRDWGTGNQGLILWVLLNPGLTPPDEDSHSISRVIDFSQAWGFEAAAVVNLYAWQAAKPPDLWKAAREGNDIVGPKNDKWIAKEVHHAQRIICAWGGHADFQRPKQVYPILSTHRKKIWALGTTVTRHPLHPLRVASATQPEKWSPHYA